MNKLPLSRDAELVIMIAQKMGARPLIVGGAVRDHVMDIEPHDIDIEIHDMSERKFRGEFIDLLSLYHRVDEVGVAFGVAKFGRDIDISLPRRDSKVGPRHDDFVVVVDTGMTVYEALARRDFTCNSMAYDPATGEIIDPFNGMGHIAAKTLHHTSAAFDEDLLRVMRAVRFATRLGFRIAPVTATKCRDLAGEMHRHIARERITAEWEKILAEGVDFAGLNIALHTTGLVHHIPADLGKVFGITQTKTAIEFVSDPDRAAAVLGTVLADCDDPEAVMAYLGLPNNLRRDAKRFANGIRSIDAHQGEWWSDTETRLTARALAPISITSVCRAYGGVPRAMALYEASRDLRIDEAPMPPLLDGTDLIAMGMTPGPRFGPILKAALRAQDEGKFTTKNTALKEILLGLIEYLDVTNDTLTG